MLQHKGFSAWIVSNDEELDEYTVTVKDDVVECWIVSKKGQTFAVCWQNDNERKIATSGHVFVDGNDVASAIMRPQRISHVERNGARISSSNVRPFVFDELQLTDDDKIAPVRDPSAQHIGTIRLEITRVVLGAEIEFKPANVGDRGPVHEKAKKAGSHVTRYGKSQRSAKGKTAAITTAPYDMGRDKPWVTFVFRYRNREFLLAQDIIPNPALRKRAAEAIIIDSDDEDAGQRFKRMKLEPSDDTTQQPGSSPLFLADDDDDQDDVVDNDIGLDADDLHTEDDARTSTPLIVHDDDEDKEVKPQVSQTQQGRKSSADPSPVDINMTGESQDDAAFIQQTLVEESQTQDSSYESTQRSRPSVPPESQTQDETQDDLGGGTLVA
ncbi:hypothetical protein BKA62DRAFT_651023 [Auriculariales sp. MPI-PUGE-AT-0066]|nr:hypothetical protein BKA62DRAFT_651023 [Auriculariales sp. MPI-PUGE-AT-0066]